MANMKNALTVMLGLMVCASASASCYTILSPNGNVVYRAANPPIDMSYKLHQVVPPRFGAGATMVFELEKASCSRVGEGRQRGQEKRSVDEIVQSLADQRQPGAMWGVGEGAQAVLDRQSD